MRPLSIASIALCGLLCSRGLSIAQRRSIPAIPCCGGGGGSYLPSPNTTWYFPPPPSSGGHTGYSSLDSRVVVNRDPGASTTMYWSASFGFVRAPQLVCDNQPPGKAGGYIGIQDNYASTTNQKAAIFSIWGATGASKGPLATCSPLLCENGNYIKCVIDNPAQWSWVAGHTYRLNVQWVASGSQVGWQGSILDENTGNQQVIGTIWVPNTLQWIDASIINFTEDFIENDSSFVGYSSCSAAPVAASIFYAPTANGHAATSGQANVNYKLVNNQTANCKNVRSVVSSDNGYAVQVLTTTNTSTTPPPALPRGCTKIYGNQALPAGSSFATCNNLFALSLTGDGRLVLNELGPPATAHQLWSPNASGGLLANMQGDGNFVVYDYDGKVVWPSNTNNHPGAWLSVQDDGNLVIYQDGCTGANHSCWASNTMQTPPVCGTTHCKLGQWCGRNGQCCSACSIVCPCP